MKEVWKGVKNYEGLYQVSNFGKIKSIGYTFRNIKGRLRKRKEKILKSGVGGVGYSTVTLYKNKKYKSFNTHELVLEAFKKKPSKKHICNHKDGNKQNNNISNLEWVTYSENLIHAFQIGLRKLKLSYKEIKEIQKLYDPYKVTVVSLAEKYKVSIRTIWRVINNEMPVRNF